MALNFTPRSFVDRFSSVLVLVIFALVFGMGVLWQKVNQLEKGGVAGVATVNQNTTTTTNTNTAQQAPPTPKVTMDQIKALFDNKGLITFGGPSRKLIFVEVADPSCPFCHVAAGENPELNNQMGPSFKLSTDGGTYVAPVTEMRKLVNSGKASFVYVYFPGHGNGEMATKALYCANEKGKFWDVHDLLMTNKGYDLLNNDVKNDKSKSGELSGFLKSAVDPVFLKSCLDSGKYDNQLTVDVGIAQGLGVSGTPGFFVNTTSFPGAYSYKDMESAVNAALQ